jgi:CRISPR type I-E-associated protein CasB/Cse2
MSKLNRDDAQRFARFLYDQHGPNGRANLAELRRAAADPDHDFRDLRILGNEMTEADDTVFDAKRLTAALFALYAPKFWGTDGHLRLPRFEQDKPRRSLGASLQRLRRQLGDGQDSLDLRFAALLNTDREDLTVPLRSLMQRLATAEKPIPVDFATLLLDLVYWSYEQPGGRSVRRTWASDYWQTSTGENNDEAVAASSPLSESDFSTSN